MDDLVNPCNKEINRGEEIAGDSVRRESETWMNLFQNLFGPSAVDVRLENVIK